MIKLITLLAIASLAACTNQPRYTPDSPTSYDDWRGCRTQYEELHNPQLPFTMTGGLLSSWADNAKLAGPAMDKSVNNCMAAKGYKLAKPQ